MTEQSPTTVLNSLNRGLHNALTQNAEVFILGEDILDPYGGSFKVTRGLSTAFPDRVLTTPISEAGITGIAGGMALREMRPVVEIMFGDFVTLIADQLVNHLTKFNGMYHGQVSVPVVIRTPMGGRRGYGPTHSQTLEKLYLGVPNLTVLAPFHLKDNGEIGAPGQLLYDAITRLYQPVLFVENKLQYLLKLKSKADLADFTIAEWDMDDKMRQPFYQIKIKSAPKPHITLAAYGYMAHLALQAVFRLAYEDEIFCELMVPTCLAPFNLSPLFESTSKTSRLLTVEEGTHTMGWGAEVLARAAEAVGAGLRRSARVAAKETIIPAALPLEEKCLPGIQDIITKVREMVQDR